MESGREIFQNFAFWLAINKLRRCTFLTIYHYLQLILGIYHDLLPFMELLHNHPGLMRNTMSFTIPNGMCRKLKKETYNIIEHRSLFSFKKYSLKINISRLVDILWNYKLSSPLIHWLVLATGNLHWHCCICTA